MTPEAKRLWLEKAEALKPALVKRKVRPAKLVSPEPDPKGLQGWTMKPCGAPEEAYAQELGRDFDFSFDFGTHLVGRLSFKIELIGIVDCPFRVKVVLGEVPAELGEDFSSYKGGLGRGWLQEEILVIDELPCEVRLPRRYAFRYVRIKGELNAPAYKARIKDVECEAESSADYSNVEPLPAKIPESLRKIDEIGLRTLANCMQGVFEDGPKRDRRLWLGDFRLQALVNYASFKNYDVSKRCLYLFAGLAKENGLVPTCLYEKPSPHAGREAILDYTALFAPTLMDYAKASDDWACVKELWPVALRQTEILLAELDPDALFRDKGKWWLFIDWNKSLDKQACENAIILYSLKTVLELARKIGQEKDVAQLPALIERMGAVILEELFDAKKGLFVSGPKRQVSWASQAWMAIAGALPPGESAKAIKAAIADPEAQKPAGPYLYHYVAEAMLKAGMRKEALELTESYWGEMAKLGADAFWEVFDPKDHFLSPYGSHLMNSYCHAWSCTPSLFIRGKI